MQLIRSMRSVFDWRRGSTTSERFEPFALLAALAPVTDRLGLTGRATSARPAAARPRRARLQEATSFVLALALAAPVRADDVRGQSPAPAAASPQTGLILLGTAGGPAIRVGRAQPSALVVVDGVPYMVDAGVGALRNLVAAGFRPSDVRAVLITHHHLDHDGGLADLLSYSFMDGRTAQVDVIGPAGTEAMVQAALRLSEPSRRIFGAEGLAPKIDPGAIYRACDIAAPGVVYRDGRVTVRAVENSHYQLIVTDGSSAGADRSYAYRFETADRVVVFTGDTGPSAAVTELAQGADLLVSEVVDVPAVMRFAAKRNPNLLTNPQARDAVERHMRLEHLSPEEVGKLAQAARVKKVVLTHFSPGEDGEVDLRGYIDGVRAYYHGSVVVGSDLDRF
jgi:ribonuclease BN (tRNA processing enzyme)